MYYPVIEDKISGIDFLTNINGSIFKFKNMEEFNKVPKSQKWLKNLEDTFSIYNLDAIKNSNFDKIKDKLYHEGIRECKYLKDFPLIVVCKNAVYVIASDKKDVKKDVKMDSKRTCNLIGINIEDFIDLLSLNDTKTILEIKESYKNEHRNILQEFVNSSMTEAKYEKITHIFKHKNMQFMTWIDAEFYKKDGNVHFRNYAVKLSPTIFTKERKLLPIAKFTNQSSRFTTEIISYPHEIESFDNKIAKAYMNYFTNIDNFVDKTSEIIEEKKTEIDKISEIHKSTHTEPEPFTFKILKYGKVKGE